MRSLPSSSNHFTEEPTPSTSFMEASVPSTSLGISGVGKSPWEVDMGMAKARETQKQTSNLQPKVRPCSVVLEDCAAPKSKTSRVEKKQTL